MKATKSIEYTAAETSNLMASALRQNAVEVLGPLPEGMMYEISLPSFYGCASVEIVEKKTEVTE